MAKRTAYRTDLQSAARERRGREEGKRDKRERQRGEQEGEAGMAPAGEIVEKVKPVCASPTTAHIERGKRKEEEEANQGTKETGHTPCCVDDKAGKGGQTEGESVQAEDPGAEGVVISGTERAAGEASGGTPAPLRYTKRSTCSRPFREFLAERFEPRDRTDWKLLLHCLFGMQRGQDSGRVVMPWRTIAECMGYGADVHRNYVRGEKATGKVLNDFLRRVLPEASSTGYHHKGIARELVNLPAALGADVLARRDRELNTPAHMIEDRVYLVTGAQYSPANRSRYRKRDRQALKKAARRRMGDQVLADVKDLKDLLGYMNGEVPTHRFGRIPQKRFEEAWAIVEGWESEEKQTQARMHLRAIADDPAPLYAPSPVGRTVRIFTPRPSLATIDSDLRQVLIPDWPELDLSSAQLAIAAKDWNLPSVRRFLDEGRSIWQSLYTHMQPGGPLAAVKPALKKGMYSTVFGAAKKNIVPFMQEARRSAQLAELPEEVAGRFLSHPLMKEVLRGRRVQKNQIGKDGGARDCFERWIDTTDGGRLHTPSILAQLAQARELQLLSPAIHLALNEARSERPRFHITLWQHDGFSVKVRDEDRRDYHLRRLQEAVNERCQRLGYPTRLEVQK